jgi:hypothetical protein
MQSLFNNQYNNLASKGRYGDTMLAHINPQEAGMLRAMGGAGTINPRTGLREFYDGRIPAPITYQAPAGSYDMRAPSPVAPAPFDSNFADVNQLGMGVQKITGYTLPTEQTFADKPLVTKYDSQGNFLFSTMEGPNYLTPDPSQPNIISQPRLDASGNVIDWGIVDTSKQDSGSLGSFLGGALTDFAPMILAGLGVNALAGSGLFSPSISLAEGAGAAGAAAGSGALSPYAAQAAGAYGGSSAAAAAAAAGSLSGIQAASAAQNALTQEALARTGITYGGNTTPANIPTTQGPTTPTPEAPVPPVPTTYPSAPTGIPPVVSAAGSTITPSMLDSISKATGISVDTLKTFGPSVIQGILGATGSVLTANQATDAAKTQADAQIRAAQIAADAARFRPVGVTTRFGSSNFQTDAQGNVIGAGYTPSAEILGYQNRLSTLANQGLTGAEGAQAAYSPLTGAAQNLFSLGQSYLAKTPEQAAQDYIAKQTALLAPSRENQLAELRNRQFQTGRGGVATSQGGNLMNTNPEMAAYYNSLAQSDLVLAAQADQEARNRITYGAGLFDTGAGLQGKYYAGQTAALAPFTNPMDVTSGLERLAQQPLDLSTAIGQKVSTANANVGNLTGQGIINAAGTMAPANAYSLGGNVLAGAANSPVLASAVNKAFGNTQPAQQQYTFNPATGQYVPVQQFVA